MSTVAGVTSKNLAQRFTPHQPMQSAGITPERVKAWLDIPKQLKETVDSGKISIGTTCLKENAELIIGLYEDMCLQHIIGMQIQDKTLGKIIRDNQPIELANPSDHGLQEPGKRIARSSLLGQDPWGDEKVPDDPEQIAGVTTYTRMQTLLKRIQDDNYLYLTTHVKRLLHKDIYLNVKNEEVRYELNTNNVRTNSKRDRMPWKRYKDVVFELLPVQIGLHELRILMTLNREDRESAQSWVQRLTEGKRLLEEKNIQLPDILYVQLAIDYLSNKEKTSLSETVGSAASRARSTRQKLLRKLFNLPYDKMVTIVGNRLGVTADYRLTTQARILKQVIFTEAQAKKYFSQSSKPQQVATPPKRKRRSDSSKPIPQCSKCLKAGLRGRRAQHKTENCKDEIREKAVKKLKEHLQKKANGSNPSAKRHNSNGGSAGKPKRVFHTDQECSSCKRAGRKYRHDPRKCKFAPGGEWHGKSKDELRVLQRKYYEKINQERQGHAQTNQVEQLKKRSKFCRSDQEDDSSSEGSETPMWRREVTLTAVQEHPGGPSEFTPNLRASSESEIRSPEITITPGVTNSTTESEDSDTSGSGPSPLLSESQSEDSDSSDTESTEDCTVSGGEEAVTETPLSPQSVYPGVNVHQPNGPASDRPEEQNTNMDVEDCLIPEAASAVTSPKEDQQVIDLTGTSYG